MEIDDIITYCLENYGYIEYTNMSYGIELIYKQNNISVFFLSIVEFDTENDNFSNLSQAGHRYRLTLCLSKNEYNKIFSKQCHYDKKYINYKNCDYSLHNVVMPHPLKSNEYYIQCINPQQDIFEKVLKELISLSYKRARQEYLNIKQK